jgi:hypothetical protein
MPIDDDTRAMLASAASPEGRARIEQARRELQEGKGIIVTPGYFDEMKTPCRLTPQGSKLQRYMRRIIFAPSFSREADDIMSTSTNSLGKMQAMNLSPISWRFAH